MTRGLVARAVAAALATSGCGTTDADVRTQRARIVSGAPSQDDGAVAAVVSGSSVVCTATLIADRILLTAAHCLEDRPDSIFFGRGPHLGGASVDIEISRAHPAYRPGKVERDLGAILLASDPPEGITPLPLVDEELDGNWVGREIRMVGFGDASAQAAVIALRREGTTVITRVDDESIFHEPAPSLACFGDSGGPALALVDGVETVIGIATAGDENCESFGVHARIDRSLDDFIRSFPEPTSGPGERCYVDDNCTTGVCAAPSAPGSFSYCSSPCATAADCPEPMVCAVDESGARLCRRTQSLGALGTTCAAGTDCASDLCASPPPGGAQVCALRCFSDNEIACPPGFECVASPASSGLEACFRAPPGPESSRGCGLARAALPDGLARSTAAFALLAIAALLGRMRFAD